MSEDENERNLKIVNNLYDGYDKAHIKIVSLPNQGVLTPTAQSILDDIEFHLKTLGPGIEEYFQKVLERLAREILRQNHGKAND